MPDLDGFLNFIFSKVKNEDVANRLKKPIVIIEALDNETSILKAKKENTISVKTIISFNLDEKIPISEVIGILVMRKMYYELVILL
jgi:hypothetical protein